MKIGIVSDQPSAVEILRRALMSTMRHEVAWVARNGAEAVASCARQLPDLVLMELMMLEMDGVESTRRIMASSPCPILIVTMNVGANASRVYEALGHGAIDAVDAPVLDRGASNRAAAEFLAKVDRIEKLVSDKAGGRRRTGHGPVLGRPGPKLLAIGASAGGPAALAALLQGLPRGFPAATVIIQHIDEHFAQGMAEWLCQHSHMPVRLAREGDEPAVGAVLIAGTNDHLALNGPNRLGYTSDPREYVYRPSVDVFFHSVSRFWTGNVVGVILTGMGRDGAVGLKELRGKGHYTIAQDQATSVVYGMPKAAAAIDAAVDVLPLESIASRVLQVFAPSS